VGHRLYGRIRLKNCHQVRGACILVLSLRAQAFRLGSSLEDADATYTDYEHSEFGLRLDAQGLMRCRSGAKIEPVSRTRGAEWIVEQELEEDELDFLVCCSLRLVCGQADTTLGQALFSPGDPPSIDHLHEQQCTRSVLPSLCRWARALAEWHLIGPHLESIEVHL
jgi:hypothetical protein